MKRARQGDEVLEDVKTFFEFAVKVVVFRHEVILPLPFHIIQSAKLFYV